MVQIKLRFFSLFCLSAILLWGCAAPSEQPVAELGVLGLAATVWRPAETEKGPDGVRLEFSPDGRRVTGCSGKNLFFAAVIADGDDITPGGAPSDMRHLRFGMLGTTKTDAPTEYENVFYRRLSDTRYFRLSSDCETLDLLNSRGAILSRWRNVIVNDLP